MVLWLLYKVDHLCFIRQHMIESFKSLRSDLHTFFFFGFLSLVWQHFGDVFSITCDYNPILMGYYFTVIIGCLPHQILHLMALCFMGFTAIVLQKNTSLNLSIVVIRFLLGEYAILGHIFTVPGFLILLSVSFLCSTNQWK